MKTCTSIKSLLTLPGVDRAKAYAIRDTWKHGTNETADMNAINVLLDTHGVEYLGMHKRALKHVYYCNTGDTYALTILFTGNALRIGCWGDLVEKNLIKPR